MNFYVDFNSLRKADAFLTFSFYLFIRTAIPIVLAGEAGQLSHERDFLRPLQFTKSEILDIFIYLSLSKYIILSRNDQFM